MNRLQIIFALALGILFFSCKKDEDFIGPELIIVDPNTFEFEESLNSYKDTIDLTTENVGFKVKFNERATWTLTLTGNTSGAIKSFKGTGNSFDSTLVSWDGSFDYNTKLKLFQDETVKASLSILGLEETLEHQVKISNPLKPFVVLNGFNAPEEYANPIFFTSPDTPDEFVIDQATDDAPEGIGYIHMTGRDIAPSGEYFLGNFGTNNGGVYDEDQTLKDSQTQLYLNFFLKGDGENGTSKLEVQFEEVFGDIFSVEVSTKHDGWKFISIPYSEFVNNWAKDAKNDFSTPGVREANLVKGMGFICSSNPSRSNFNIAIDYACLTIGKPLLNLE